MQPLFHYTSVRGTYPAKQEINRISINYTLLKDYMSVNEKCTCQSWVANR